MSVTIVGSTLTYSAVELQRHKFPNPVPLSLPLCFLFAYCPIIIKAKTSKKTLKIYIYNYNIQKTTNTFQSQKFSKVFKVFNLAIRMTSNDLIHFRSIPTEG